jgi:hypothetical protein
MFHTTENEKCIPNFNMKTEKQDTTLELDLGGRIILNGG